MTDINGDTLQVLKGYSEGRYSEAQARRLLSLDSFDRLLLAMLHADLPLPNPLGASDGKKVVCPRCGQTQLALVHLPLSKMDCGACGASLDSARVGKTEVLPIGNPPMQAKARLSTHEGRQIVARLKHHGFPEEGYQVVLVVPLLNSGWENDTALALVQPKDSKRLIPVVFDATAPSLQNIDEAAEELHRYLDDYREATRLANLALLVMGKGRAP